MKVERWCRVFNFRPFGTASYVDELNNHFVHRILFARARGERTGMVIYESPLQANSANHSHLRRLLTRDGSCVAGSIPNSIGHATWARFNDLGLISSLGDEIRI